MQIVHNIQYFLKTAQVWVFIKLCLLIFMLFVFNAFVEKSTSAGNIPRILVNKRKDNVYSLHILFALANLILRWRFIFKCVFSVFKVV